MKLDDPKAKIMQICFSYEGILYILVLSDKNKYIYYRINIKKDMFKRDLKVQTEAEIDS